MKGTWKLEVTDTFGGEANYCWVDRQELPGKTTERGVVRRLKAMMGITGQRADVTDYGGGVEVRPVGKHAPCIVGFAQWESP